MTTNNDKRQAVDAENHTRGQPETQARSFVGLGEWANQVVSDDARQPRTSLLLVVVVYSLLAICLCFCCLGGLISMTGLFDLRSGVVLLALAAGLAAFAVACASLSGSDDGAGAVSAANMAAVDHSYAATGTAWAYGITRTARAYDASGTALAYSATAAVRAYDATGTALAYDAVDTQLAWEGWGTALAVESTATAVVREATKLAVSRVLTATAQSGELTATFEVR